MVVVIVIGPLSEELIFRGLLLDWLGQKMSAWPAALVISLGFAALHGINLKEGSWSGLRSR